MIDSSKELEGVQVNALRAKVKNLKTGYIKAVAWKNRTGQGTEDGETLMKVVVRLCPHFETLDEIFSDRPNVNIPFVLDYGYNINDQQQSEAEREESDLVQLNDTAFDLIPGDAQSPRQLPREPTTPLPKDPMTPLSKRPRYVNNSLTQLADVQKSRQEMNNKKLKIEEQRLELQNKWEERKIDIEVDKLRNEQENILSGERIRMAELAQQERLNILQIEKDERLARLELELKYKKTKFLISFLIIISLLFFFSFNVL